MTHEEKLKRKLKKHLSDLKAIEKTLKEYLDKETRLQVENPIESACPKCKSYIFGEMGDYCPHCGQRLEW